MFIPPSRRPSSASSTPEPESSENLVFDEAERELEFLAVNVFARDAGRVKMSTDRVVELIDKASLEEMLPEQVAALAESMSDAIRNLSSQEEMSPESLQPLKDTYTLIQEYLPPLSERVEAAIEDLSNKPKTEDEKFSALDPKDLNRLAGLLNEIAVSSDETKRDLGGRLKRDIISKLSSTDLNALRNLYRDHPLVALQPVEKSPRPVSVITPAPEEARGEEPSLITRIWARVFGPKPSGPPPPLTLKKWSILTPFIWFGAVITALFRKIGAFFCAINSRIFQGSTGKSKTSSEPPFSGPQPTEEEIGNIGKTLEDFPERYREALSTMKDRSRHREDGILKAASFAAAVFEIRDSKEKALTKALEIEEQLRSENQEERKKGEAKVLELKTFLKTYEARKGSLLALPSDPALKIGDFTPPPIDFQTPKSRPLPEFLGPWSDSSFVNLYNDAPVVGEGDEGNASQSFAYAMYMYTKKISSPTGTEKEAAQRISERFSEDIANPPQGDKASVVDYFLFELCLRAEPSSNPAPGEESSPNTKVSQPQLLWEKTPPKESSPLCGHEGWEVDGEGHVTGYLSQQFVNDAKRTMSFIVLTDDGKVAYAWTNAKMERAMSRGEGVLLVEAEKAFRDIKTSISEGSANPSFVPYVMSFCHQGLYPAILGHIMDTVGHFKLAAEIGEEREPLIIRVRGDVIEISTGYTANVLNATKPLHSYSEEAFYHGSIKITIDKNRPRDNPTIEMTASEIKDPEKIEELIKITKRNGLWHEQKPR